MKLKFLRIFAQLNIAIILLLVIAGFSVLGTIIEQDQTIEYYKQLYNDYYLPGNIMFWQFLLFCTRTLLAFSVCLALCLA